MRGVILLVMFPMAVMAYGHAYRPIVPPDDLPQLCDQMEYAAKWLADHPDDMDGFLDRYFENGSATERVLADIAVRQSLGIESANSAKPASVRSECINLMRQVVATTGLSI